MGHSENIDKNVIIVLKIGVYACTYVSTLFSGFVVARITVKCNPISRSII